VFSLLFFVYIAVLHPGVDLKEVPTDTAVEQTLAEGSEESFDISQIDEPWVYSDEMASYGKTVYKSYCLSCHGVKGAGDGPAAATLTPKPRNLIAGGWINGGTSQKLFETLQNGLEGTSMMGFKGAISKADRWALVHYIRSITEDKPEDDAEALKSFAASAE
jgi:mono/diheme cytochrome c family protein